MDHIKHMNAQCCGKDFTLTISMTPNVILSMICRNVGWNGRIILRHPTKMMRDATKKDIDWTFVLWLQPSNFGSSIIRDRQWLLYNHKGWSSFMVECNNRMRDAIEKDFKLTNFYDLESSAFIRDRQIFTQM